MSGPIGTSQLMYSAAAGDFYSYQIANSLRNSAAQDGSGTGGGNTDGTYNIFIKRNLHICTFYF